MSNKGYNIHCRIDFTTLRKDKIQSYGCDVLVSEVLIANSDNSHYLELDPSVTSLIEDGLDILMKIP